MRGIIDTIGLATAGILGGAAGAIAHNGWVGSGMAAVLGAVYIFVVAPRIPDRRRERQEEYDATPDGRLTRHH